MEYYGYAGNVLHVNLSTGRITREPLDTSLARKFIGGPEMGLHLLLDMLKPNTDPLSPENVLVFGTGPLTGTLVPGSGKCYLSTKYSMPASKDGKKYFVSTSMFGSRRFGSMMKNAGYDHVVITGRAEKPSYLKVTDEDVEICDASDIWGKDVYETGRILRKRHRGKTGNCGTWVIGRAGENLVRLALGWTDDWYNAGRFAGAVAGAKNLKAMVTLGNKGIKVANRKRFMEALDKKLREISEQRGRSIVPLSMGPAGRVLKETMVGGRKSCSSSSGCACKSVHEVKKGKYRGVQFGGIYFGFPNELHRQMQLKDYFENYGETFKLIETANSHGLCLASSIRMILLVTKMYERGVLSREDTGGQELRTGELDCYLALLEKIANRQDIGALMAEGWYPLCERLGIDVSTDPETECAISKGVDLVVDARTWPALFPATLSTSSRQGTGFSPAMGLAGIVHAKTKQTHSATYWTNDEISLADVKVDAERMGVTKEEMERIFTEDSFDTGRLEKYGGEAEAIENALGVCSTAFHEQLDPTRDIPWLSEVYSAVTGFDITPRELLRAGERIFNLEKLLNVREGFGREDDRIPPVYLQNIEVPLKTGEGDRYLTDWFGKRLTKEDLEEMLDHYYEERGWDIHKGVPTKKKLIELGLEDFVEIVEPL